jgi:hypothetical protein
LASPVKNGITKTGRTKNGLHIKKGALTKKEEPKEEERKACHDTAPLAGASGRGAALNAVEGASAAEPGIPTGDAGARGERQEARQGGAGGDVGRPTYDGGTRGQVGPIPPERIVLASWRQADYFRWDTELYADGKAPEAMSMEDWRRQLDFYGGAPAQVTTPQAHRQACEIAAELSARTQELNPVSPYAAMLALASAICTAHRRGKLIYSLAFVAENLARKAVCDSDACWAFNLPRRRCDWLTDAEFDETSKTAASWAASLESLDNGAHVDALSLTSTPQIEALAWEFRQHGGPTTRTARLPARPRRCGRRPGWNTNADRAWREQRMHDALELRKSGKSYKAIAAELGVDISTAHRWVREGLAKTPTESADELRKLLMLRCQQATAELVARLQPATPATLSRGSTAS